MTVPQRPRHRFERATANLDPPLAVVDMDAFRANAADLVRRAGGTRIRVASKSLRVRRLIAEALALDGFAGVMAFSLAEALWLAETPWPASALWPASDTPSGSEPGGEAGNSAGEGAKRGGEAAHGVGEGARRGGEDVLVGYPSVDRAAIARLATQPGAAERITLTIDDTPQLDLLEDVLGPHQPDHSGHPDRSDRSDRPGRPDQPRRPEIRLCLDIDTSWRPLGAWIGARRSPVRTPEHARRLAAEIAERPGFRLVGLLAYEAQLAGTPDSSPAVRLMKRRSAEEIAPRRAEVVRAVREVADLEFVNAGGTGSLETSGSDPYVDELTAGSGLLGPALFDGYRGFRPHPAALLALPVVRRPADRVATVFSGGWIASGPPGGDRAPVPYLPRGLRLTALEGAGEVQTPVTGEAAADLEIGDRVWFRHAKAGEPFEHLEAVHLVETDRVAATVPTYRGEGRAFGV